MDNIKPILFCDFDGTLCHDRYWRKLPSDKYEKVQKLLFRNDTTLINDWMRGKYSSEEINQFVSQKIGMPSEELWDVFVKDCRTMKVSKKALGMLNRLRDHYTVILLSGNMDSFSRFTQPALGLENYFDYISNSFHEGMHKTDNGGELFLKYAEKYNVPIQNCIIIDDSENACKVFNKLGGTTYLITKARDILYYLEKLADRNGSVGRKQKPLNSP